MSSRHYDVSIVPTQLRQLAVIREVAWAQNIGPKISATLPGVYERLRLLGAGGIGPNVVVYHPDRPGDWDAPPGIQVEIGVELKQPLHEEQPPLLRSELPDGRAAHTLHLGPYQELPQAHGAVHQWCREHGHTMTGRNWEVYGPHADDPSQLRTEVFYELK
jgi:effector-binding domain-containing protein